MVFSNDAFMLLNQVFLSTVKLSHEIGGWGTERREDTEGKKEVIINIRGNNNQRIGKVVPNLKI